MKVLFYLIVIALTACTLNDPDEVAYQQVVVPTPNNTLSPFSDYPSIDVTTTKINRY